MVAFEYSTLLRGSQIVRADALRRRLDFLRVSIVYSDLFGANCYKMQLLLKQS